MARRGLSLIKKVIWVFRVMFCCACRENEEAEELPEMNEGEEERKEGELKRSPS